MNKQNRKKQRHSGGEPQGASGSDTGTEKRGQTEPLPDADTHRKEGSQGRQTDNVMAKGEQDHFPHPWAAIGRLQWMWKMQDKEALLKIEIGQ